MKNVPPPEVFIPRDYPPGYSNQHVCSGPHQHPSHHMAENYNTYQPHNLQPTNPTGNANCATINKTFAPSVQQSNNQAMNIVVNTGSNNTSKERPWSTQLCGCMEDVGGCFCGIFCAPCFVMTLASRMQELFCLPCLVPQSLMAMRVKIRAANNIKGSICCDCVVTSCCPMLSTCQLKREMDNIDHRKPGTEL